MGSLAAGSATILTPGHGQAETNCRGARPIPTSRTSQKTRRMAVVLSMAAHAGLAAVVLLAAFGDEAFEMAVEPPVIPVSLVRPAPLPPPAPLPRGDAEPAPRAAAPSARPTRAAPTEVVPLLTAVTTAPAPMPSVGDAELAGARGAGAGAGGGEGGEGAACDMVRRLQGALRRDPEVRTAAAEAHRALGRDGRAVLVWNGEWLQSPGQAGKGLAGVRQAIALEVAFAPEACRAEPMRGLVVLALADGPAAPRLALGAAAWRWTDLLGARRR
jgi:hypothetical protein